MRVKFSARIIKFASRHLTDPKFSPSFIMAGAEQAAYKLGGESILKVGYGDKETVPRYQQVLQDIAQVERMGQVMI